LASDCTRPREAGGGGACGGMGASSARQTPDASEALLAPGLPPASWPRRRLLDPMTSPVPSPLSSPRGGPGAGASEGRPAEPRLEELIPNSGTQQAEVLREPEASLFSSWCVLTNTLLGVGILGLPWAVSTVGLALGIVMLMGAGAVSCLALHFLAHVAVALTGGSKGPAEVTFYSACMAGAPAARYVVDAAIAVKCFGVATSYLQVIGQLGAVLLSEVMAWTSDPEPLRRQIIVVALLTVIAPTVFHKRITKTASQNLIAIVAWLYITVLIAAIALGLIPVDEVQAAGSWQVAPPPGMTLSVVASTLPIFIFSFTCHQNLFPLVNELKQRSLRRLDLIIVGAIATGLLMYGVVGLGAYMRFAPQPKPNIMLDLPRCSLVRVGELLAIVAVIFTYPLQLHPCRRSMMILVASCMGRFMNRDEERWCRRILTVFILMGTATVACLVRSLGITLAFVGALGSNTVVLIMPAFLFLRLHHGHSGVLWYLALAVFIAGCIILPTSVTAVIHKALSDPAA